jgi:hypothetical protein
MPHTLAHCSFSGQLSISLRLRQKLSIELRARQETTASRDWFDEAIV